MASFFDKPSEVVEQTQGNPAAVEEVVDKPVIEGQAGQSVTTPLTEKKEEVKSEPVNIDWLGEVNKNFKTDFKTTEDFGKHFEKAKKVDEYEPKISEYETRIKQYEDQVQKLDSSLKDLNNPLSYFTSQESYVAEQLKKQHPDKHPVVLQEVVTTDSRKMDDLDVLVKDALLTTPGLKGGELGAKETILFELGLDESYMDKPKEEWPISVQNRIMIKANAARKAWDELKGTVQLPKVTTPEEKEAEIVRQVEERKKQLSPLQETASKFDKFHVDIDEGEVLDFNVPDEYKQVLPDMFETYFVKGGVEPTKENLASFEELKEALLLRRNIKQIYKVIKGDVEAKEKAARDKLLGNENPTNTKTGLEITNESDDMKKFNNENGLGKLLGRK